MFVKACFVRHCRLFCIIFTFFFKTALAFSSFPGYIMEQQALIAQLVEQVTLNHWVLGSSPRERTILSTAILRGWLFYARGFLYG